MSIQDNYSRILEEISENFYKIKDEIVNAWGYKNFNVKIDLTYDSIKDKFGNNAFGAFYSGENIIKISYTELISFVGIKMCNNNLKELGLDNSKKIFYYYTLYILAHEVHHVYLYKVLPEEYKKIKEEDKEKDYKDSKLEKYADEHAIRYLNKYGSIAKFVGELAIKLREEEYKKLKVEDKTDEENKEIFIIKEIEKIIKSEDSLYEVDNAEGVVSP
jgi:hypothetical protein